MISFLKVITSAGRADLKELEDILTVALHHSESRPKSFLQGGVWDLRRPPPPTKRQHDFWVTDKGESILMNQSTISFSKMSFPLLILVLKEQEK